MEKIFVEEQLLPYLFSIGADVDVIESKAVFSVKIGRYIRGIAPAGFSDIVGNLSNGISVFIEAKAPGKWSTISQDQWNFLHRKINTGAFAVVCDDVGELNKALSDFLSLGNSERKNFLRSLLPKKDWPIPIPLAAQLRLDV